MAAVIREVKQQVLNVAELRARMAANGVKVRELAEAAGMNPAGLSAILRGRDYFGPARQARVLVGVRALGLDTESVSDDESATA